MQRNQNIFNLFNKLPIEVLMEMFSFLNPEQIAVAARVNKEFNINSTDQLLWKDKLKKHFPHIYNKIEGDDVNWYAEFRNAYAEEYRVYDEKNKLYKALPPNIRKLFSLVKEGDVVSLKSVLKLSDLDQIDINGVSLLNWAKKINNQILLNGIYEIALKEYVLDKNKVDITKTDERNRTILHWAILCHQSAPVIDLLIQQGVNLNLVNAYGQTPFHYAVKSGHIETVKFLIEKNVQLDIPVTSNSQERAIHIACREGQLDIVKLLIETQPNLLNQVDDHGQTPVHWAAIYGHSHIVKYLTEQGANLNLQSGNNAGNTAGYTALHWAAKKGHVEIVKFLIDKNVPLDISAAHGARQKAIHLASIEGQLDIVKLLIKKQSNLLNQADFHGLTPIHWAAARGHSQVVSYLAEQGADLNLQSNNNLSDFAGYTPLHLAAKNGRTKTIRVLVENQANIEALNYDRQTPADVAVKNSRYANEVKLLDYLAKVNRRPDNHFKTSFTLFGVGPTINFGYSAKQKKDAATALKKVIFDGADESSLAAHKNVLNNGDLKRIYHGLC